MLTAQGITPSVGSLSWAGTMEHDRVIKLCPPDSFFLFSEQCERGEVRGEDGGISVVAEARAWSRQTMWVLTLPPPHCLHPSNAMFYAASMLHALPAVSSQFHC